MLRYTGFSTVATDITEIRRIGSELISAKGQAESFNRAKIHFLSHMSREMRTPMNAVIGMTNIAKSADGLAKKDYCLSKIDDVSNHLLDVITTFLICPKSEPASARSL